MTTLAPFDYAPLGHSSETLKAIAKRINIRIRTTAESIIAIGRELRTAKGILGVTVFGHWIEAEFGFTERTARNYIAVVEQLGEYEDRIGQIPASALYLLASQSVPQEAIETVIARAEQGEPVDRETVKEIIADSQDYVETVSDEEDPEEDESLETVSDPQPPRPTVAPLWHQAGKHIEAALELYKKHAQECDQAAEVISVLETATKLHDQYVRNIETT